MDLLKLDFKGRIYLSEEFQERVYDVGQTTRFALAKEEQKLTFHPLREQEENPPIMPIVAYQRLSRETNRGRIIIGIRLMRELLGIFPENAEFPLDLIIDHEGCREQDAVVVEVPQFQEPRQPEIQIQPSFSYHPKSLAEFEYQDDVLNFLIPALEHCLRNKKRLFPDTLLAGPPGLGKTSIAHIIANQLERNLLQIDAIANAREMKAFLTHKVKTGDILFVDEIHNMKPKVQEVLLPYLQDGRNPSIKDVPYFTFICGTTDKGSLRRALLSRFSPSSRLTLRYCETWQLEGILQHIAHAHNLNIDADAATLLAGVANGTPRTLVQFMKDILPWSKDNRITLSEVEEYLDRLNLDDEGLGESARKILYVLESNCEKAMGLENLAQTTGIGSENTIKLFEEPLRYRGYIITSGKAGRKITDKGIDYLRRYKQKEREKQRKALSTKQRKPERARMEPAGPPEIIGG